MLALLAVLFVAAGGADLLSLDDFLDHRADALAFVETHPVVALFAVGLTYVVSVAFSLPGALVLTLISGFLFGPFVGGLLALLSATTGATILFLAARSSLGVVLRRRAGPRLGRFAEGFRKNAFHYLLFLRLVPIAPFWLVNLAPALFGVPARVFVLSTLVGTLPGSFAFATIGAGLDGVVAAQEAACRTAVACHVTISPKALLSPELVIGSLLLGALSLLPMLWKRHHRRRSCG